MFNQTNNGRTLDSTNNVLGNVGGMVGLSIRDKKHYLYLSTFVSGAVDLGNIGYTTTNNSQSVETGSTYTFASQTSSDSSYFQHNKSNHDYLFPTISDGVNTYTPIIDIQSYVNRSTPSNSTSDNPLQTSDKSIVIDGVNNTSNISYSITHGTNSTPPSSTSPTVETNIPLNGTVSIDVTSLYGGETVTNNYTVDTVLKFDQKQNQFVSGNAVVPFAVNHTIDMPNGKELNISGTDSFGHYRSYGYNVTTLDGTHNVSYDGHEVQIARDVDVVNFYPSNSKHYRGAIYGTTTITQQISANETKTTDIHHDNTTYSPQNNVYVHGYDSQNGGNYQNRTTITSSTTSNESQQNHGSVGPVISGNIALNQRVGLMHDKLVVGDFQFIPYAVGAVGVAFSDSIDPFFGEGLGGLVSFDKIKAVKIGTFVELAAIQMIGTGVQAGYANFGAAARAGVQFGV